MPGHDGVGSQLDQRKGDPLALNPPRADGGSPDLDDGQRFEVDEVVQGDTSDGS